jgi:predicted ATPase
MSAASNTQPAGLVGREKELNRLTEQVQSLSEGRRRIVFITGEAGIGKTSLVEALCQHVATSISIGVARGQCVEGFGAKEEYYPVMEALSQLCASPDGERACRILAKMAPMWLTALNRQSETATSDSARSAAHERMPGDLCAALEELAVDKPLILIFEDLNWADDSTLHLISALARRRAPAKLMVLGTFRSQDVATEHPLKGLKQDLLMRRLCVEMALEPLGKTAIHELLMKELKQQLLPIGFSSFVHQRSEGNPLFAIAILEHMIAQRFLVCVGTGGTAHWEQRAQFQEMEAGVPDGLAQMIELDIARLTPHEQRMLEAGSLINAAFPAWAIAAALAEDDSEIEEACDGLARRVYFLKRAGEDELPNGTHSAFYVFAHGLYREVLYERQAATRRAKRHVRIAERLEQLFSGHTGNVAREIAFHYEAAGDWQRAVSALRDAANHAQLRQAYAEAENLLEHTLRTAENLNETDYETVVEEIRNELARTREGLLRDWTVPESFAKA